MHINQKSSLNTYAIRKSHASHNVYFIYVQGFLSYTLELSSAVPGVSGAVMYFLFYESILWTGMEEQR
jgi:hypothetical protein